MIRVFDHWLLLPERIVLHEPSATAVLADAHLGYSAARQHLGDAVPWRTVEEEMQPLMSAAARYDIRTLIVAGDLFERGFDALICQQFRDVLNRLNIGLLGLVPGNHDRGVETAANDLPLFPAGIDLHGWRICHGDQAVEAAQAILGHWHPALRWKRRKVPAFLVHDRQLVLPAFSRDAAGADVQADDQWRGWSGYAIVGDEVIDVALLAGRASDGLFSPSLARPANEKTHDGCRGS